MSAVQPHLTTQRTPGPPFARRVIIPVFADAQESEKPYHLPNMKS